MNKLDTNRNVEKIKDGLSMVHTRIELTDITPFSGAILRKAEFENNFDKVYSRVIEKITQFEIVNSENENLLEIFGIVGG